jgi:hypothetical protein
MTKIGYVLPQYPLTTGNVFLDYQSRPKRTFCVPDGLDECDESLQYWLITKLLLLNNDGDNSLRLILTSRDQTSLR